MSTLFYFAKNDELEREDTTESDISSSYLDILLNIDSNGRQTTTSYSVKSRIRKGHKVFLQKRALFVVVCYRKGTLLYQSPKNPKHL
jgi:hypothetical protein